MPILTAFEPDRNNLLAFTSGGAGSTAGGMTLTFTTQVTLPGAYASTLTTGSIVSVLHDDDDRIGLLLSYRSSSGILLAVTVQHGDEGRAWQSGHRSSNMRPYSSSGDLGNPLEATMEFMLPTTSGSTFPYYAILGPFEGAKVNKVSTSPSTSPSPAGRSELRVNFSRWCSSGSTSIAMFRSTAAPGSPSTIAFSTATDLGKHPATDAGVRVAAFKFPKP